MNATDKAIFGLPPKRRIQPPEGGWKSYTLYLVNVSYRVTNPIHKAYFMTGNLDQGEPGTYSQVWRNSYEQPHGLNEVYFMEVVQELHSMPR